MLKCLYGLVFLVTVHGLPVGIEIPKSNKDSFETPKNSLDLDSAIGGLSGCLSALSCDGRDSTPPSLFHSGFSSSFESSEEEPLMLSRQGSLRTWLESHSQKTPRAKYARFDNFLEKSPLESHEKPCSGNTRHEKKGDISELDQWSFERLLKKRLEDSGATESDYEASGDEAFDEQDELDSDTVQRRRRTSSVSLRRLPSPSLESYDPNHFLLPPLDPKDEFKKTLVLDLDETMIHSELIAEDPYSNHDFVTAMVIPHIKEYPLNVYKRPFLDAFLKAVADEFEVVVFTASSQLYADPILNILDPENKIFKHRLYQEACSEDEEGNYVKDISLLGRDMRDIIVLDNSPTTYSYNPSNAIAISSYYYDPQDVELQAVLAVVQKLQDARDVRLVDKTVDLDAFTFQEEFMTPPQSPIL